MEEEKKGGKKIHKQRQCEWVERGLQICESV